MEDGAPAIERPGWPYTVGAAGAGLFGAGALAFTLLFFGTSPSHTLEKVSLVGMAGGGVLLGVAWIPITRGGMFKGQYGGFAAIAGSFAVPLALLYAYLSRKDFGALRTAAVLIMLATALFAFGHAIVRGPAITRWIARIALAPLLIEVIRTLFLVRLSPDLAKMLAMLSSAGLAAIGFALMLELPRMRTAPPPGEPDLRL